VPLIITPTEAHELLEGRKTTHRIPARGNQPCRHRPGERLPVQVLRERETQTRHGPQRRIRPGRSICHVNITRIDREPLEDLTPEKAIADGWATDTDFLDNWTIRHGDPPVRTIEHVWVLHLQVVPPEETLHLLTYSARPRGSEHGYTNNPPDAMRAEPEAVDRTYAQTLTQRARAVDDVRANAAAAQRETLDLDARMLALAFIAKRDHIDVRGDLRQVRHLRKRGKNEEALSHLRRVERRVIDKRID
jgi:hypothetical protein